MTEDKTEGLGNTVRKRERTYAQIMTYSEVNTRTHTQSYF